MDKPPVKLTQKQRKLIKGIAEGKTQKQAAIDAGYSPRTADEQAYQTLQKTSVRGALSKIMEDMGLSDDYLLTRHKELIEATKAVSAVGGKDAGADSVDFIDVPDWTARAKGLEMAYKLKGSFAAEKQEVSGPNGAPQQVEVMPFKGTDFTSLREKLREVLGSETPEGQ